MASKYDRFWEANKLAGNLVETIDLQYGKYGRFTVESADIIVFVSTIEQISPEVHAVTWQNETTFRNYSESNPNTKSNPNDDFNLYDVGPMQINIGTLKANLGVNYISITGLDINKIVGNKGPIFTGDPIQNHRCGTRLLKRMGQGVIVAKKDGQKFTMFEALTSQSWANLTTDQKNERRVVNYTGPEARPARLDSWRKYSPMFKKFFEVYNQ